MWGKKERKHLAFIGQRKRRLGTQKEKREDFSLARGRKGTRGFVLTGEGGGRRCRMGKGRKALGSHVGGGYVSLRGRGGGEDYKTFLYRKGRNFTGEKNHQKKMGPYPYSLTRRGEGGESLLLRAAEGKDRGVLRGEGDGYP